MSAMAFAGSKRPNGSTVTLSLVSARGRVRNPVTTGAILPATITDKHSHVCQFQGRDFPNVLEFISELTNAPR